jgi:hypothetical protein
VLTVHGPRVVRYRAKRHHRFIGATIVAGIIAPNVEVRDT